MMLKRGRRAAMMAIPVGKSRDVRQRRVEVLWVKARGGEVFVDPSGRRFAVFRLHADPPRSLTVRAAMAMDEIPTAWRRVG